MIDPVNLKGCSPEELAMFACCVHGKTAAVQAEKFNSILEALSTVNPELRPLSIWMTMDSDEQVDLLKQYKLGQYTKIAKAWNHLAAVTPPFTVANLLKVPGIGPKTARFITVYSGTDANRAVLDVHVMRWMRQQKLWKLPGAPKNAKEYERAETIFLAKARELGVTPAELDTQIWQAFQRKPAKKGSK